MSQPLSSLGGRAEAGKGTARARALSIAAIIFGIFDFTWMKLSDLIYTL